MRLFIVRDKSTGMEYFIYANDEDDARWNVFLRLNNSNPSDFETINEIKGEFGRLY